MMNLERNLVGSAVCALLCSATAFPAEVGFSPDRFTMLNIIPAGDAKLQAQDAIEYEARTGNPHVLYVMTLHPQGKPASRVVDEAIKNYRIFVKTLEGSRVKPGILLQSILGHWARVDREVEPWQRTIDIEGKIKRFCPLDRDYQAYIRETAARLAAERPCLILTDDDVRAFSPKAECFCPLHRAAFNRRTGRDLKTTDEFRELIAQSKLHSQEHDAFVRLQRDTVLGVCKLIREGIDSVDPTIPAGACQPGWPWDGVRAHEYAKVLAAKGQTPFLRLGNGQYVEKSPKEDNLDKAIMTMAWQDFYGDGIFLLDEADTYPHNPWAKCAITMHSKMLMSAFIGLKGAKLWFVNCHKQGFPISRNYTEVLAERRGYYDAVAALTVKSKLSGIVIPCHPDFPSNTVGKDAGGLWDFNQWCTTSFGVYGIPMRAAVRFDEDAIYALGGWHAASRFSDDQIRAMLSHRALIDGGAAVNLINRGFGKLIGVELSGEKPQFVCERDEVTRHGLDFPMSCEPPIFKPIEGAKIRSSLIWTPPPGSGEADVAAPSATLFRNSLGGTVVTVAYRNADMPRDHRHSESRKAWLERRIMDLNGDVPYDGIADTAQNTLVLVRRGTAGEDYVLFSNLSFDPARSVRLKFAKKPAKVEVLALNGVWKRADWTWKDGVLDVAGEIPCYNERVLRIVR